MIWRIILIVLLIVPELSWTQNIPERTNKLVNDLSSTLSNTERNDLEEILVRYDRESSTQIAIVIMPDLGGYDIAEYAFSLGEQWGIGQAGKDNGALILLGMKERKVWIATGYGLESTLTDALAKRIIENEMKPEFRQGRYYNGLKAGAEAIILVTKGEYKGEGNDGNREGKGSPLLTFFLIILIFLIIGLTRVVHARRYARMNHIGFWAAWMLLNSSRRSHGGSWSSFSGGSGGFGGGGSGFGGFGGGSFGGGGAGGSW